LALELLFLLLSTLS